MEQTVLHIRRADILNQYFTNPSVCQIKNKNFVLDDYEVSHRIYSGKGRDVFKIKKSGEDVNKKAQLIEYQDDRVEAAAYSEDSEDAKRTEKIYAQKRIDEDKVKWKKSLFLAEVCILNRIKSKYISWPAHMYMIERAKGKDPSQYSAFFKYMNGGSLFQMIKEFPQAFKGKEKRKFSLGFTRYTLFCIAKGIKVLHDLNIVHQDLRTDNIFMSNDGKVVISSLQTFVHKVADGQLKWHPLKSQQISEEKLDTQGKEDDIQAFGVIARELLKHETVIPRDLEGKDLKLWIESTGITN